MTDTATASTDAALQNLAGEAEADAKAETAAALPGLEADAQQTGDDLGKDLGKAADDLLALGKQITEKVYGDAKTSMSAFIDKLPEPLPLLLQTVAVSSEQVIGALGDQAYEGLQSHEKQLITDTQQICGQALAFVESFFARKTK